MIALKKNGWTKKSEILKYLYGSIQYSFANGIEND